MFVVTVYFGLLIIYIGIITPHIFIQVINSLGLSDEHDACLSSALIHIVKIRERIANYLCILIYI